MRKLKLIVASGTLVAALFGVGQKVEAHVPSSACSHWYQYSGGNYTGGFNATCGTGAAGTQYAFTIHCTNGETKGSGLRQQGTTGFGVACDPGHVVDTHSVILR